MEKRFTFRCWNCEKIYTLFQKITNQQELIVQCPFCDAEAVVKLDPYKKEKKSIFKMSVDGDQSIGPEYQFPDVIPTQKPS